MKTIASSISHVQPNADLRSPGLRPQVDGPGFQEHLKALQTHIPVGTPKVMPSGLRFSNHAVERMQARGIRFQPDEMLKIESAIQKAASKGAKDTLLLSDKAALIVSVKDNTVVTVMDKANLKENVFTNIDSTVVI